MPRASEFIMLDRLPIRRFKSSSVVKKPPNKIKTVH